MYIYFRCTRARERYYNTAPCSTGALLSFFVFCAVYITIKHTGNEKKKELRVRPSYKYNIYKRTFRLVGGLSRVWQMYVCVCVFSDISPIYGKKKKKHTFIIRSACETLTSDGSYIRPDVNIKISSGCCMRAYTLHGARA